MKKFLMIIIMFFTVFGFKSINAFGAKKVVLNKDDLDKGIIKVSYISDSKKAIRMMIKKGDVSYVYALKADGTQDSFDLQLGNGTYSIVIYENLQGTTYMPVYNASVKLNVKDQNSIYTNSIQNVNWSVVMAAIKKGAELTKGMKNDDDKIDALYNYVTTNFKYDYVKWKNINNYPNPYIPVIDETYQEKKGICYDYSALFGAMLRSQKIPAKLIMGYCKNVSVYHAWNEIYLEDSKKWVTIDTTYDATMIEANKKVKMVKDDGLYTMSKFY